jgi:hypothetical protein
MMRIARVLPLGAGEDDLRGAVQAELPCASKWKDGVHGFHHCQYVLTRYAPKAPLKDGYVELLHDDPCRCTCGATHTVPR